MTDVFISYSRKDQGFVEDLKDRLEGHDLEVWVDIDGLYAGEKFWPEVTKAIDVRPWPPFQFSELGRTRPASIVPDSPQVPIWCPHSNFVYEFTTL